MKLTGFFAFVFLLVLWSCQQPETPGEEKALSLHDSVFLAFHQCAASGDSLEITLENLREGTEREAGSLPIIKETMLRSTDRDQILFILDKFPRIIARIDTPETHSVFQSTIFIACGGDTLLTMNWESIAGRIRINGRRYRTDPLKEPRSLMPK